MGLLMSVISVTLKAEQASAHRCTCLAWALVAASSKSRGHVKTVTGFQPVQNPAAGDLPVLWRSAVQSYVLVYLGLFTRAGRLVGARKNYLGPKNQSGRAKPGGRRLARRQRRPSALFQRVPGCHAGWPGGRLPLNLARQSLPGKSDGRPGLHRRGASFTLAAGACRHHGRALLFSAVNAFQLWMQVLA